MSNIIWSKQFRGTPKEFIKQTAIFLNKLTLEDLTS